jgi:hypothetical protein
MSLSITPGTVTSVLIYGGTTGAIATTTISGGTTPYTIAWTSSSGATAITDQTAAAKSTLKAGTYRITVTDSAEPPVSVNHDYVVSQSSQLVITAGDITHASDASSSDGSIASTTVSGGVTPYTIAWSTSDGTAITVQTTAAHTGLKAGTYRITVTDNAGASVHHDYVILDQTLDGLTLVPGIITEYDLNGKWYSDIAESTVSGGDGDYTVLWTWSSGATAISTPTSLGSKTGLHHGTYTLTVEDGSANGARHVFYVKERKRLYKHATGYSTTDPLKPSNAF